MSGRRGCVRVGTLLVLTASPLAITAGQAKPPAQQGTAVALDTTGLNKKASLALKAAIGDLISAMSARREHVHHFRDELPGLDAVHLELTTLEWVFPERRKHDWAFARLEAFIRTLTPWTRTRFVPEITP